MKTRCIVFVISFVLSATFTACDDGGGSSSAPLVPQISGIAPLNSCSLGPVHISSVSGSNFSEGITVTLVKDGEADIQATGITVSGPNEISCDFDLTGVATGAWKIRVSYTKTSAELAEGLTVTNALYVSTSGNDGNTGTASSPKLTVQAAIDAASSGRHVRVSEGTYETSVNIEMKQNVSLTIP